MHNRFAFGLALLIGIGCFLVALVNPASSSGVSQYLTIGLLLGTMFSHATLAGAWMALGPLPLIWRFPLAVAWLAAVLMAFAVNLSSDGGPDEAFLVIGGCLAGQWILAQLPLWGLAVGYGLRACHRDERPARSRGENQFGIRQLMIITAVIAIVLAVARIVVLRAIDAFPQSLGGEPTIFLFLAATGLVMMLPLILSALLPRYAWSATLITLVFIGLGTYWELSLMRIFVPGTRPDSWDLAIINGFQALWILLLLGTLRLNGYALLATGHNRSAGGANA